MTKSDKARDVLDALAPVTCDFCREDMEKTHPLRLYTVEYYWFCQRCNTWARSEGQTRIYYKRG